VQRGSRAWSHPKRTPAGPLGRRRLSVQRRAAGSSSVQLTGHRKRETEDFGDQKPLRGKTLPGKDVRSKAHRIPVGRRFCCGAKTGPGRPDGAGLLEQAEPIGS